MILIDVSIISCLLLDHPLSSAAKQALARDDEWISVSIWLPQFLDILAERVQSSALTVPDAISKLAAAKFAIRESHENLDETAILNLAKGSGVSASQATFILVARRLGAKLVTADAQLVERFPADTTIIRSFDME